MVDTPIPIKPIGVFKRTNPPVFLWSALTIFGFILVSTLFTQSAREFFQTLQTFIATYFSWVFTLTTTLVLLFALFLLFSPWGRIRLGAPDEKPEFSWITWFAMLFSAGMGIGLVFWSIAEPISHYAQPPVPDDSFLPRAEQAMQITYFHWGLHAWAIYCVVGLALAYFAFRIKLPLTIRSAFYPILGQRIFGPIGNVIDIFAVVSTMFGVSTSLGLGAMQVNAGLNFIAGVEESPLHQVTLIALITAAATVSVVLGLVKGISRLSHFNLWLGVGFMLFVLLAGPTLFVLQTLGSSLLNYAEHIWVMGYWSEVEVGAEWRSQWTTFYWAWWVAWSPFVGMFIARVSRGRTIREFVLGALFAPCLATFTWLAVFGGTALHLEIVQGEPIAEAVSANVSTALFVTLQNLPMEVVSACVATLVIVTYFVTSSDSGSLVIDIITAGGDTNPPKNQRIFWAVTEGVVAIILLLAGGLKALQTAAIASGFLFALVLVGIVISLAKALQRDSTDPQHVPDYF